MLPEHCDGALSSLDVSDPVPLTFTEYTAQGLKANTLPTYLQIKLPADTNRPNRSNSLTHTN